MTDPTQQPTQTAGQATGQPTPDDDPLQVSSIIWEALQVTTQDAAAEQEEGRSVEALTQSFEDYVSDYTDTFAQAWEASQQAYQTEVENWQAETSKALAQFQATAGQQPSPSSANMGQTVLQQMEALKQRLSGVGEENASAAPPVQAAAKPAAKATPSAKTKAALPSEVGDPGEPDA